jgi:hypothetical protein
MQPFNSVCLKSLRPDESTQSQKMSCIEYIAHVYMSSSYRHRAVQVSLRVCTSIKDYDGMFGVSVAPRGASLPRSCIWFLQRFRSHSFRVLDWRGRPINLSDATMNDSERSSRPPCLGIIPQTPPNVSRPHGGLE